MTDGVAPAEFAGKVAIVTGGGAGLGYAIARAFARNGAQVVIAGRTQETLARAAAAIEKECGAPALAVAADVAEPKDCERMVAAAVERFGAVDILVNNAAYFAASPLIDIGGGRGGAVFRRQCDRAAERRARVCQMGDGTSAERRDRQRQQHRRRPARARPCPLCGVEGGAREPDPVDGGRMGGEGGSGSTRSRPATSRPKAFSPTSAPAGSTKQRCWPTSLMAASPTAPTSPTQCSFCAATGRATSSATC